jgi:hypothetical protein
MICAIGAVSAYRYSAAERSDDGRQSEQQQQCRCRYSADESSAANMKNFNVSNYGNKKKRNSSAGTYRSRRQRSRLQQNENLSLRRCAVSVPLLRCAPVKSNYQHLIASFRARERGAATYLP